MHLASSALQRLTHSFSPATLQEYNRKFREFLYFFETPYSSGEYDIDPGIHGICAPKRGFTLKYFQSRGCC